jgi:hypothetical protein
LKLPFALKQGFWVKSTLMQRKFSSNLTVSNSIKILNADWPWRQSGYLCAKRMVTAMVTIGLGARAGAVRQYKFHHARRLKPDLGPESAKAAGNRPRIGLALAFA